ncbi:ribonucleoside hydrolase RihC [Anaerorhabdus furcosa]|uniref:Non-specific riboncleoside hydrolase n=1 Tax=Anaerorhabdus furcosa TaxID=118967 RepID=A0A1T4NPJ3_9FIRM|nr:ribonucleoside hydrolase RihC [Anaerorhabdus furcosa]SJZ81164.1 non-specific riboncleoside hydrolase [Anaerorhabdus furcosa]
MTKRPIIIDTDPGIDDAVAIAIALFSDELDVKCISTVNGNVGLDKTTYNALRLVKFFGKENIPVVAGASKPLLRSVVDASEVHGKTGMEGFDFEDPDMSLLRNESAIEYMRKVLMESDEPVILLPIGPLTNIALLLSTYPEVKSKIKEIVMMGGSTGRGNCGVMSEFNFHADPEAAKMVFHSGLKLVMVPLDAGINARITKDVSEKIRTMNKTGHMFYELFRRYRGSSFETGLKMYDSYAIAYVLQPDIFETVETFVDIETQGEYTSGCSVVDLKGYLNREANTTVVVDADPEKFKQWFLTSVEKCC